jgi:hypothetical protein
MFEYSETPREIKKASGRVYQTCENECGVAIDWAPSSPIMGCTTLTGGEALFHPVEGKVVRFPRAFRRRRGTVTIVVRAGRRPDLLELFELATEMKSELGLSVGARL